MNGSHRLKFQISFSEDEVKPEIITLNQFDDALKFEDRYEALQTLGQGAHAVVKVAKKKDTDEIFAVKIVRSGDQEIQNNVKRTFNNTRCLRHPNIAQDIELFINEKMETSYLIMEYCAFDSLESIIKKRKLTIMELRIVIKQLLLAIQHAHQKGICHRDLKPDNVLVDLSENIEQSEVRVKVVDFGVSRRFQSKGQEIEMLTKTGNIFYCAPEIYHKSCYSKEVDIWAIGVIAFQCLFQKLPLHSDEYQDFVELLKCPDKWKFKEHLKELEIPLQNLIIGMLEQDSQKRITIDDALRNSFFEQQQKESTPLIISTNLENLIYNSNKHMKQLQTSLAINNNYFGYHNSNLGNMIQKLQGENNQERVDVEELTRNFGNIHITQKQNEKRGPIQLMNSIGSSNVLMSRFGSRQEISYQAQSDALRKICDIKGSGDPFGDFAIQQSQELQEQQESNFQQNNSQKLFQQLGSQIESSINLTPEDQTKVINQLDSLGVPKRSSVLTQFFGDLGIKEVDEITEDC
ncbi:unnamed protein product (macronuclear) [Paramecium tetraurelia]|uniref:Protein kinase domain-containing protein n=1 Tax=Paramecium tetraurelia TaxID=5888 RepID=A0D1L9_PARTE|nr:uncharacterized protein GSPATT00012460001 [Paramecium tetraurelia]CAK76936.1 unnamed protein product [Paramecium tetraurelia]|eukprot:XP_001444333.1 hypothetical protein (macronuclear) [Paramecium tetraurelia strain d4-2]